MCQTVKTFVLDCIARTRGDDLYRAQTAFAGLSPEEMAKQHGQSGKTRQQIIDGYKAYNDKCDAATAMVEKLL